MIAWFDLIFEFVFGVSAVILIYLLNKSKKEMNTLSYGFLFIVFSTFFDVIEEVTGIYFFDLGTKILFLIGLVIVFVSFRKICLRGKNEA